MPLDLIHQILNQLMTKANEIKAALDRLAEAGHPADRPDRWLPEDEVMRIFGVTSRTLYNWKKKNALAYNKFGGTSYYLESEIYKLTERKTGSGNKEG